MTPRVPGEKDPLLGYERKVAESDDQADYAVRLQREIHIAGSRPSENLNFFVLNSTVKKVNETFKGFQDDLLRWALTLPDLQPTTAALLKIEARARRFVLVEDLRHGRVPCSCEELFKLPVWQHAALLMMTSIAVALLIHRICSGNRS